ncbi:MAG: prephenate dehydrogenase [Verrucomicrobia bacterium]|nr:prephenate dehydrogenase [Verrucomicrobiota bacterium]
MNWQKVTIVGVGLLGGSLGLAIKKRGLAKQVAGYVRRAESVTECQSLGVADTVTQDICGAVRGSDLVIICTPIAQMRALAEQMVGSLAKGALVTDVGSVKGLVIQELDSMIRKVGAEFVGSHPMAGAEQMGARSARPDLFVNAVCAVTPTKTSSEEAVRKIEELWAALGSRPIRMTPEMHDALVSRSSHLPHIVAAELANYVLSPVHPKEQSIMCATGFRDTTRVASGSPEMWRDIALANGKNLSRVLGVFIEDLREFQFAVENGDGKTIEEFFATAKQRRDEWRAKDASPSPE